MMMTPATVAPLATFVILCSRPAAAGGAAGLATAGPRGGGVVPAHEISHATGTRGVGRGGRAYGVHLAVGRADRQVGERGVMMICTAIVLSLSLVVAEGGRILAPAAAAVAADAVAVTLSRSVAAPAGPLFAAARRGDSAYAMVVGGGSALRMLLDPPVRPFPGVDDASARFRRLLGRARRSALDEAAAAAAAPRMNGEGRRRRRRRLLRPSSVERLQSVEYVVGSLLDLGMMTTDDDGG
mmetsp:Transcript_11461/g.33793  ORF Transcript_11461/g.33793 Transcript_11461/m.33793 type:complete len:240 (-) Transcript_11461:253-972(-)